MFRATTLSIFNGFQYLKLINVRMVSLVIRAQFKPMVLHCDFELPCRVHTMVLAGFGPFQGKVQEKRHFKKQSHYSKSIQISSSRLLPRSA